MHRIYPLFAALLFAFMLCRHAACAEEFITIRGTLTQDLYYAIDDAGETDRSHVNPHVGAPAPGVRVDLIALSGDDPSDASLIAQTVADSYGAYSLTVPSPANMDSTIALRFAPEGADGAAYAEKIIPASKLVQLRFRSAFASAPAKDSAEGTQYALFPYSEGYFFQPPALYQHDLARLSLGMAISAFSAAEADLFWNQNIACGRERNIAFAYDMLGFENAEFFNYDVHLNDYNGKVAFSIASKEVSSVLSPEGAGEEALVVAIVLRGGGYGCEWSSNFNVAAEAPVENAASSASRLSALLRLDKRFGIQSLPVTNSYHNGFYTAASEVIRELKAYLAKYADESRPVKLWLTGYSRAAATANLAAGMLLSDPDVEFDALYAYTFATPNGAKTPVSGTENAGIFNIVYEEDAVPNVAFAEWDYAKNGETLCLSDHSLEGSEASFEAIRDCFQRLTGRDDYDPATFKTNSDLIAELKTILTDAIPSEEVYAEIYQPFVRAAILCCTLEIHEEGEVYSLRSGGYDRVHEYIERNILLGIREAIFHLDDDRLDLYRRTMSGEHSINLWNFVDDDLVLLIEDVVSIAQLWGGNLDDLANEEMLTLIHAAYAIVYQLMDTSASLDSVGFAHHPEVYLAWMTALDGETLFDRSNVHAFDTTLLPIDNAVDVGGRISIGKNFLDDDNIVTTMRSLNAVDIEFVPATLDIDGDGVGECLFFDQYGMTDYMILQFLPESMLDRPHAAHGQFPSLYPLIQYCDAQGYFVSEIAEGFDRLGKEFHRLCIITGADGCVYACVTGCINYANGWPEEYPEFFMLPPGSLEFVSISPDYQKTLLSEINGVQLDRFLADFDAQYVEELGGWCFVTTQIDHEQHRRLLSFFTMSGNELQPLARYLDGERME